MAAWGVRVRSRRHVRVVSVEHGVTNGRCVGVVSLGYEGMVGRDHVRVNHINYEGVVSGKHVSVDFESRICRGPEVVNFGH